MAFPRIGGAGIGLNLNNAIGSLLPNAPGVFTPAYKGSNALTLPPATTQTLPAGTFQVLPGAYSSVQFLDPVSGQWRTINAENSLQPIVIDSDGGNFRIANLTGTPVGALITNAGASYTNGIGTAATGLTVTISAGGSVWVPVVGGAINSTVTITTAGSYTYPPLLVIDPPPVGGVQATATCTISGNAITAVTVTNQGAGYTAAPLIRVLSDPRETRAGGGVLTVNATLASSGALTALYPSDPGTGPVTSLPTFTFSPASTTAATVVMNWVVTSIGITSGGAGGTGFAAPTTAMVINGALTAGTRASNVAGPIADIGLTQPRPAFIQMALSVGTLNTTGHIVIDAGFGFQAVPTVNLINAFGGPVSMITPPAVTALVGGVSDTSWLQPL